MEVKDTLTRLEERLSKNKMHGGYERLLRMPGKTEGHILGQDSMCSRKICSQSQWLVPKISALEGLRQENSHKFEASLN